MVSVRLYRMYHAEIDGTPRCNRRVRDRDGNTVTFLSRPEFAPEVAQNFVFSAQQSLPAEYEASSSISIFMEHPSMTFEETKTLLMLRRDLAMKVTQCSIFALDICHMRSMYKTACPNYPCGLFGRLQCSEEACRLSGGCFCHFAHLSLVGCNK